MMKKSILFLTLFSFLLIQISNAQSCEKFIGKVEFILKVER